MKKNLRKILLLTLTFVFVLSLAACGGSEEDSEKDSKKNTQLGTSDFSIVLPEGYALKEDDMEEDQVAYFYKDDNSIDFDVYQWEKGDEYTLESEAKFYAAEYDTEPESVTVNGINGMKYVSKEEYEDYVYTVVNYMFEDNTYIVELSFWTVGTAEEYAAVDKIINTLEKK